MDYPKITKEIFENAIEKGLWEHNNIDRHISEINIEIAELTTAIIQDKNANTRFYDNLKKEYEREKSFKHDIKNTIQDETADIIISILSLCGYFSIEPKPEYYSANQIYLNIAKENKNPFILINRLHTIVAKTLPPSQSTITKDELTIFKFSLILSEALQIATYFNIDIEYHIKHKIWYNSTRNKYHMEN